MTEEEERARTAMFIGHHDCYFPSAEEKVTAAVEALIQKGTVTFLNGGQGKFDGLSARCVYRLKAKYPFIRNLLVIPYLTFTVLDKEFFDEIIFPDGFERYHFKAAIPARNRYMVQKSAFAVCYVWHDFGGAWKTYQQAQKAGLEIVNLAEDEKREPPAR